MEKSAKLASPASAAHSQPTGPEACLAIAGRLDTLRAIRPFDEPISLVSGRAIRRDVTATAHERRQRHAGGHTLRPNLPWEASMARMILAILLAERENVATGFAKCGDRGTLSFIRKSALPFWPNCRRLAPPSVHVALARRRRGQVGSA